MNPKPCAFCGLEAVLVEDEAEDGSGIYHFVECENCGAQGPMVDPARDGKLLTKKEAVERWNKVRP